MEYEFDAFISHASEDKEAFVRPLAKALRQRGLHVWYDEFSLNVGDSLRRSIDRGLAKSRFGIVVLSPHFFAKSWTEWELDGLVARQNSEAQNVLLPVWHQVTAQEVASYSPPLADRLAARTSDGVEAVAQQLVNVLRPQGSALTVAREALVKSGWQDPPPISDDWWLDMAGAAERPSGFERWDFPLPAWEDKAEARGRRIAQAALQEAWKLDACDERITQLTRPGKVHQFLASEPGLLDACKRFPIQTLLYLPQLAIPGCEGPLLPEVQACFEREDSADNGWKDRTAPLSFRAPDYWGLDPERVACTYVQGELMGPSTRTYEPLEYCLWLLSEASNWMPKATREFLTTGMIRWSMWPWSRHNRYYSDWPEFGEEPFGTGALEDRLYRARSATTVQLRGAVLEDVRLRFAFGKKLLGLPETVDQLVERFDHAGFVAGYFEARARRHRG